MEMTNIRTVSVPSVGKLPLADNPGTFTPSGKKRNHKPGRLPQDGGFTSSAQAARLELNLNAVGVDLDAINDIEEEDITVRLSDGAVYLMSQASLESPAAVGGEGEIKVVLFSNSSERIS